MTDERRFVKPGLLPDYDSILRLAEYGKLTRIFGFLADTNFCSTGVRTVLDGPYAAKTRTLRPNHLPYVDGI
jgi:hypothetical protein